jgi:hypothetical protein
METNVSTNDKRTTFISTTPCCTLKSFNKQSNTLRPVQCFQNTQAHDKSSVTHWSFGFYQGIFIQHENIDWSMFAGMTCDTGWHNNNNNNVPLLSLTGEIHNVAPREAPWCHGSDSNLWPYDREADALPLELSGQTKNPRKLAKLKWELVWKLKISFLKNKDFFSNSNWCFAKYQYISHYGDKFIKRGVCPMKLFINVSSGAQLPTKLIM